MLATLASAFLMMGLPLAVLAATVGVVLVALPRRAGDGTDAAIDRVNALLPQTQCAQCGYPGCRPYAAALVAGTTTVDRCPPGGDVTRQALAALLGVAAAGPAAAQAAMPPVAPVARIDEAACIGCALCLPACPVDAIVGAPRHLHTVLTAACTGCGLCLPPCPVDCIELVAAP